MTTVTAPNTALTIRLRDGRTLGYAGVPATWPSSDAKTKESVS